jgi:hypothetical protein
VRLDNDSFGDPSYIHIEGPIEIHGYEYSYAIGTQAERNKGLVLRNCEIYGVDHGPVGLRFLIVRSVIVISMI